MIKVYVAGPISKGDLGHNLRQALDAANKLMAAGYAPFVPQLSIFWYLTSPPEGDDRSIAAYNIWLPYDFEWIKQCDCLLRLPGESFGADKEVAFAKAHGIPVFYSLKELDQYYFPLDTLAGRL